MKFNIKSSNGQILTMRNDSQGLGHYGAPRGTRKHRGVDFEILPHRGFKLPFDVKIKRKGLVKVGQPFNLLELAPTGVFQNVIKFKFMYSDLLNVPVGSIVPKDEIIGRTQDVAKFYGGSMKNHLHVETRIFGKLINPNLFFNV